MEENVERGQRSTDEFLEEIRRLKQRVAVLEKENAELKNELKKHEVAIQVYLGVWIFFIFDSSKELRART